MPSIKGAVFTRKYSGYGLGKLFILAHFFFVAPCANDSHYHLKVFLGNGNHAAEHTVATCFSMSYFEVIWSVCIDIHLLQKKKPPA